VIVCHIMGLGGGSGGGACESCNFVKEKRVVQVVEMVMGTL
jgi:hypothetical protein